jgi:single-stranded-DNA-specific exonuclease
MYAAGLTLSIDKVEEFKKKFEQIVEEKITIDQLIPRIDIDRVINLDVINYKFLEILKQMAPFGPSNMQPVFASENLYVSTRPRILKEEHLKFFVKQENSDVTHEAIGFGLAKYFELIDSGMRFKMAYSIEDNEYLGQRSLQLYVKDLKFD